MLDVQASSMLVRTNRILPHREYELVFPVAKNREQGAILSWSHRNRRYSRKVETFAPKGLSLATPARVVIRIGEGGEMSSRLESPP